MSTKTDFYETFHDKPVNVEAIREFQSSHPSIQVRRVGNASIQIKFHDRERFVEVSDWFSDFRSKAMNNLYTQLSICSKLVPQDEVLQSMRRVLPQLDELFRCKDELFQLKETVELERRDTQRLEKELKAKVKTLSDEKDQLRTQYVKFRENSDRYLNGLTDIKFMVKEGTTVQKVLDRIDQAEGNS